MALHMDHLEWRAAELSRSPDFDRTLFTLHGNAHHPRRESERFADMTLAEMEAHIEQRRYAPRIDWRRASDPPPRQSADAMRRYVLSLYAAAGHYLGATAAATVIHEMARATVPMMIEPMGTIGYPAPTGATASSAAAALTGADCQTPGARRAALCRVTPADRSGFVYLARLRIDG